MTNPFEPAVTLLASASTMQDILKSVARFYGGEEKDPIARLGGYWTLHSKPSGREIMGVRIVLLRGRYRFEATP